MTTKRQARAERRARLAAARAAAAPPAGEEAATTSAAPAAATFRAPRPESSRRQAVGALALAAIVVAAFFPAFGAGFVWDDAIFVGESAVHSPDGLGAIWFSPREIENEGHYWPMVYTSFWLESRMWGLAPLGYHVTNVLLYVANVLLVWRLLRRLGAPGAWAVAALWAVHPLHVESVVWVIERKDVLSGLFCLWSALAYIRFDESGRWPRYGLSLVLFALGLLSKSAIVTLPAALLILHWWKRGRLIRADLVRTAPFFLVGFAITFADLVFYRSREVLDLDYSLIERALIAARALWFYAGKLAWPSDLAIIYPLWDIRAGEAFAWLFLAAAAAVPAVLWFLRRRLGRGPLAGVVFFAVTLSPALGFLDYGYMQYAFVADRFQYLAGIGLLAILAAGGYAAAARFGRPSRLAGCALLALVLGSLGALTWRHASVFRDELTLFGHIASLNPKARDAHHNLSSALATAGRYEESLEASLAAVALRPNHSGAHSNLGLARMNLGRLDEAETSYRRALDLDAKNRNAMQNLGELMRLRGRFGDAVEVYRRVIEIDGDYALAHAGLGESLFRLERYDEALAALNRGLALEEAAPAAEGTAPFRQRVFSLRLVAGQAAREIGRYEESERHVRRAMELIPGRSEPLVELANLRFRQERPREAEEFLRRVRELAPADPAAIHRTAESLRSQGRVEESIAVYERALGIEPDFAPSIAGIGNAMHKLERHGEAVSHLERALALDSELAEAAALHRVLAQALLELGREQEAESNLERALELNSGDTRAMDYLAMLRFGAGRYEEALDLYRRRLAAGRDDAQTHANVGVTLYRLERYAEAERSLSRALERDPDHSLARDLVAEIRALGGARP